MNYNYMKKYREIIFETYIIIVVWLYIVYNYCIVYLYNYCKVTILAKNWYWILEIFHLYLKLDLNLWISFQTEISFQWKKTFGD